MQAAKKTLLLGASDNPSRYSYMALNQLQQYGHPVNAIGRKKMIVGDVEVSVQPLALDGLDTVTLYLNPENQRPYYDYILSLHPKRVIFNPGTENEELQELLDREKIPYLEACTLVMLHTGQY